jgi:NADPH:quinone reductase-like Zn-dependent oxidoreductase
MNNPRGTKTFYESSFYQSVWLDSSPTIWDIETPSINRDQLLVKVYASSVNPVDWKIRAGQLQFLTGYKFPMVLGFDVSGEVVAVGESVTRFQTGDKVYAYLDSLPGGAYAEYAAVSEQGSLF